MPRKVRTRSVVRAVSLPLETAARVDAAARAAGMTTSRYIARVLAGRAVEHHPAAAVLGLLIETRARLVAGQGLAPGDLERIERVVVSMTAAVHADLFDEDAA